MDSAVRLLFHEVADLTRSEREKLFAERRSIQNCALK
jgi:hypothetical protein